MTDKLNRRLALGIPVLIFLVCFCLTFSSTFKTHEAVFSTAIVIDLLVTAPLIYFLFIRKSSVSKLTVIRVFVLGVFLAGAILNTHSTVLLHFIKTWISPALELLVLVLIGRKFYRARKTAKAENRIGVDFLAYSRLVLLQLTGNEKFGNMIASEISVLYYTFARKSKSVDYKTVFTSYKENGIVLVLGMILFVFVIEASASHFIFSHWNKTFAWVITAFSFYTCLQVFAHMKAIKARPLLVHPDSLEIHNGLAGDAYISFDNIEKIECSGKLPLHRQAVKIALLKGFENHNMVIYLKEPISVTKIFGIKKQADTVLFFVDKPAVFLAAVQAALANASLPKQ